MSEALVDAGDNVESTNCILKKGYNAHYSRGGGAGKRAVEREAMVVQQVWEWWFLTFDLPLLHYNTPHTAAHGNQSQPACIRTLKHCIKILFEEQQIVRPQLPAAVFPKRSTKRWARTHQTQKAPIEQQLVVGPGTPT